MIIWRYGLVCLYCRGINNFAVAFLTLTLKNYFFSLAKYNKKHKRYAPCVLLIIPCKNLDENFEQNIVSFYRQDYENYLLWFVVEDKADPHTGNCAG